MNVRYRGVRSHNSDPRPCRKSKRVAAPLAVTLWSAASLLALSACGGSGSTPPPVAYDSTSTYNINTLPSDALLPFTAHQGLEAETITNPNAAIPTVTLVANPTGQMVTTIFGFNLTLPDGKIGEISTGPNATDLVGPQDFKTTVFEGPNQVEVILTNGATSPLTYSTYGIWMESDGSGMALGQGVFATGIPTVAAQMPKTGSGSYSGNVAGFVTTASAAAQITGGAVALTANFAANTITGAITNITTATQNGGIAGQLNDISLTAGTISGTGFSGTATPVAATANTTVNITGATGTFGGKFLGPSAAEIGGSLSLSGAGNTLIAAFGAHH